MDMFDTSNNRLRTISRKSKTLVLPQDTHTAHVTLEVVYRKPQACATGKSPPCCRVDMWVVAVAPLVSMTSSITIVVEQIYQRALTILPRGHPATALHLQYRRPRVRCHVVLLWIWHTVLDFRSYNAVCAAV